MSGILPQVKSLREMRLLRLPAERVARVDLDGTRFHSTRFELHCMHSKV